MNSRAVLGALVVVGTTLGATAADMIVVGSNVASDMVVVERAAAVTGGHEQGGQLREDLSQSERFSYFFGFNAGANLSEMGFVVDEGMFLRGFREGLADPTNSSLSAETIRMTLEELNKHIAQKQKEKEEKWLAESKQRGEVNKKEGEAFLKENKKKEGVITTRSGLQYVVLRQGEGPKPRLRDTVKVIYSGRLLDGTEFANSEKHGKPVELPLSRALDGWKEGMTLMPVGSKYRFFIPSELAYGSQGQPGSPIYPYAVLVFDIELLGIIP